MNKLQKGVTLDCVILSETKNLLFFDILELFEYAQDDSFILFAVDSKMEFVMK